MLPVPSNFAHIISLLIRAVLRILFLYTSLDLAQLDPSTYVR